MQNSSIEWTTHTFNPWEGCSKVSAGCANCYAEDRAKRFKTVQWGPNGTRRVASESYWSGPLKWDKAAKTAGERHRVFCASLADVFEDWKGPTTCNDGSMLRKNSSGEWITDGSGGVMRNDFPATIADVRRRLFDLIDSTPTLDWLLLTKRPENIMRMLPPLPNSKVLGGYTATEVLTRPNVWFGTSVENQQAADERIPHLLKVPAKVRFLSMEPLLGAVILPLNAVVAGHPAWRNNSSRPKVADPMLHWVIVGGESGPNARPCDPRWVRSVRQQCNNAGVAFFHKQWGEWAAANQAGLDADFSGPMHEFDAEQVVYRVGKKAAGRLLDGRTWDEMPEVK